MKRCAALVIFALSLLFAGSVACAQASAPSTPYKFDFGAEIGMSGYLGDANSANIFKRPGLDGEISMRYLPDTRWALRAILSGVGISGSTADIPNKLPEGIGGDFKSTVVDLGVRAEFNFLPYGIGESYKRLRRCTPYLTLGVGVAASFCGGEIHAAPTLPMGMGVKYKVSERINLCAEFTMTKAFSDKFDGNLSDLNQIKTEFYKSTDWYSRFTVGISFEFGKRCETCHYVD